MHMSLIRTPTEKVQRTDTFNHKATEWPLVQGFTSTNSSYGGRVRELEKEKERED